MGIRYRKKKKIASGVHLNLSKSGISTTLKGWKGFSVNIGKNGAYLNIGIPRTGFYSRQKISGKYRKAKTYSSSWRSERTGCWHSLRVLFTTLFMIIRLLFTIIGVR